MMEILIIFAVLIYFLYEITCYERSDYKNQTSNSYINVRFNKGLYGEYLCFKTLEKIKENHYILANVYLPKKDDKTTELDLIYINSKGVYVIESKNYKGLIFGDNSIKMWTQMLKSGTYRFYNPILQNKSHIEHLERFLNTDIWFVRSVIVFGNKASIKDVHKLFENISVINRSELKHAIHIMSKNSYKVFSNQEMIRIYSELRKHSNVSDAVKRKHISDIKNYKKDRYYKRRRKKEAVSDPNQELFDKLKNYRNEKSKEESTRPYFIYSNEELELLIKERPKTLTELRNLKGFGELKCSKYGKDVLNIINPPV